MLLHTEKKEFVLSTKKEVELYEARNHLTLMESIEVKQLT